MSSVFEAIDKHFGGPGNAKHIRDKTGRADVRLHVSPAIASLAERLLETSSQFAIGREVAKLLLSEFSQQEAAAILAIASQAIGVPPCSQSSLPSS